MKYLLDTCALIDMIFAPERLSNAARDVLENEENELIVNIASFWEIMIKEQLGKLDIQETSAQELKTACDEYGIQVAPIAVEHVDKVRTLPRQKDHGDPFDRLLICHALCENLPIISSDGKLNHYAVDVIW